MGPNWVDKTILANRDKDVGAWILAARSDPKRAAGLADKVLSDRPTFNRLVEAKAVPAANVQGVAGQVHYQPVVLPVLIAAKDIPPLAAVARTTMAV